MNFAKCLILEKCVGNSLQTRGPIRVKGLVRQESKPNWLQIISSLFYLMSKCLSKQLQLHTRSLITLIHSMDYKDDIDHGKLNPF